MAVIFFGIYLLGFHSAIAAESFKQKVKYTALCSQEYCIIHKAKFYKILEKATFKTNCDDDSLETDIVIGDLDPDEQRMLKCVINGSLDATRNFLKSLLTGIPNDDVAKKVGYLLLYLPKEGQKVDSNQTLILSKLPQCMDNKLYWIVTTNEYASVIRPYSSMFSDLIMRTGKSVAECRREENNG